MQNNLLKNRTLQEHAAGHGGAIHPVRMINFSALNLQLKTDPFLMALMRMKCELVAIALPIGFSDATGFIYDEETTTRIEDIELKFQARTESIVRTFMNKLLGEAQ